MVAALPFFDLTLFDRLWFLSGGLRVAERDTRARLVRFLVRSKGSSTGEHKALNRSNATHPINKPTD